MSPGKRSTRQLRLGAFMRPVSIHTGAWRYPGAWPDANFNFAHLKQLAQTLERGRFDAFFMADHLAVLNMPTEALQRSHTVTSFEPFTLLSALAQHTKHIGLVATASTTWSPACGTAGPTMPSSATWTAAASSTRPSCMC
jgi:alkanesulfonate monooxygenase